MQRSRELDTIELAKSGSAEAFESLVTRHQKKVRMYLARFADCRQTADDLAQDVFVTAFQRLSEFRGASSFSTWIIGIARNKALAFLRNQIRQRERLQLWFHSDLAQQQLAPLESGDPSGMNAMLKALRHCLNQLPESSAELIESFYFENHSASEIAERSQLKSSAIRMKLLRIRNSLQKCIARKTGINNALSES